MFKSHKGSKVEIRFVEGARRTPLDAITTGGKVRPRFTFEVAPDKALYTFDPKSKRGVTTMYRGGDPEVLGGTGGTIILAGEPGRLIGSVAPGCWLAILGPVVGVGVILAIVGATDFAWAAIGIAMFFVAVGWIAFPDRPPAATVTEDRKR